MLLCSISPRLLLSTLLLLLSLLLLLLMLLSIKMDVPLHHQHRYHPPATLK
jgi:hypothetical protein